MRRLFRYLWMFILMIIAFIINVIEGLIMLISYPLRGIDYVLHVVFKFISTWTLELAKRFNFISIFRRYEE